MMIALLGMVAFSVDVGYIVSTRSELQTTADSAALAGAAALLNRNKLLQGGGYEAMADAARAEARQFALANRAGGVPIRLDDASIVIGRLSDPGNQAATLDPNSTSPNAVRITARRAADENGALNLFFGPALGRRTAEVEASATAAFTASIQGFTVTGRNPDVTHSKLLPFAMDVEEWNRVSGGFGSDNYTRDPVTGAISNGPDGVAEAILYSATKRVPGNCGTVNIGAPNNSTADIRRQILYGINQQDFAYLGGSFELGPDGTRVVSGDPGLSAGFKAALQAVRGQPRVIPLYSQVTGNGANAQYTIVGFAGVTVTDVQLTGGNKRVVIQPEVVVDPTVIPGDAASSSFSNLVFGPVLLYR
jgi:Flp pilus assembly protein TadG